MERVNREPLYANSEAAPRRPCLANTVGRAARGGWTVQSSNKLQEAAKSHRFLSRKNFVSESSGRVTELMALLTTGAFVTAVQVASVSVIFRSRLKPGA